MVMYMRTATATDWLATVRDELLEVFEKGDVFTKGVSQQFGDRSFSFLITDQDDHYEAYITVESWSLVDAKSALSEIQNVIAIPEERGRDITENPASGWVEIYLTITKDRLLRL